MERGKKMIVKEMMEKLELFLVAGASGVDKEVTSGYVGDLLSWVMGNAEQGAAWVTIQSHVNIVAVATLLNLSCIIVADGCHVDEETVEKANEEGMPIFATDMNAYQMVKKLVSIGIE
jgi:serine kinase of HPr protein (carbohydrate metabolism regulator)